MSNPQFHEDCPRCHGQGFYLSAHGRGYYRDGSFGHNQWEDCTCSPFDKIEKLPPPFVPTGDPN